MLSFSAATSPAASTVIDRDRSPLVTAVATSAIARTCEVRAAAIRFTFSVKFRQVPAAFGTFACPPSFPSKPTSRATVVTWSAKVASVSIISLMVSASCSISPFASRTSLRLRLPFATEVTTLEMLRTWLVRFEAIRFTLSVRSFHVPATPFTSAWPPSFPSVPTTRATRVTSDANELSWSTIVLTVFFSSRISPRTSTVIFLERSPFATAVAKGDLSKKITVDVRGEILELKNTVNTMVDQLNSFASEVTRVARVVGTEGKLGGQAEVKGVAGTWKDLTDNVNLMASNLTNQVRGIAKVVTAVANGNLKRKLVLEAKGEIEELAETINTMVDQLSSFAAEVTRVAREVGIEGKLGGQASVPGAAGTWRDLTDNVNRMAAALTTQVRAIAEVATAVTKGDLSRSIAVDTAGEVAALKDTINEMIRNLKDTTRINTEQDWLKTNVARFTRILQGQRDLLTVSRLILSELAPLVSEQHGVFYINQATEGEPLLRLLAS